MTTTAPDRQPSTPGHALRWAADELKSNGVDGVSQYWLRRWADELDAAPATYTMPAEPPETVTELWDRDGEQWCRLDPSLPGDDNWVPADTPSDEAHITEAAINWEELLVDYGPLSTAPPAGYNPPTVHGCDDCSVEPGETHRWAGCPGARRARERLSTAPPAGEVTDGG